MDHNPDVPISPRKDALSLMCTTLALSPRQHRAGPRGQQRALASLDVVAKEHTHERI